MKVNKVKLINFRNYENSEIEFEKGINVITGQNGSGKTNIVESIDFLTIGKSFKTNEDKELIRFKEDFARVELEILKKEKMTLKGVISKENKKISYNDIELKKLSELSGKLLTILFTPEDVLFFKDSPNIRRRFIDLNLSSIFPEYLKELAYYKNLLKERNALLKNDDVDKIYLDIITEKMIKPQYKITSYRIKLIESLNKVLSKNYKKIDDEEVELKLHYQTSLKENNFDTFKEKLMLCYKNDFEQDVRRKYTSTGIHHDDIKMYRNGREIDLYGSQGQNRLAVLSLKLSMREIIKENLLEEPIVILDDVLSELDGNHQNKLLLYLREFEQVFITCAKEEINLENTTIYVVDQNRITRR